MQRGLGKVWLGLAKRGSERRLCAQQLQGRTLVQAVIGRRRALSLVQTSGFGKSSIGRASFCSKSGDSKREESSESKSKSKSGFFSSLKDKIEDEVAKNPELGKSFADVKKSMPFSASAADRKLKEASEQLGKAADTAADASEKLKAAAKESGEAASKFASSSTKPGDDAVKDGSKGLGGFASEVWRELLPQNKSEGTSSSEGGPESGSEGRKGSGGDKESEDGDSKTSLGGRFQDSMNRVTSSLPESFGNDDKSWGDALRAVFGLRPSEKKAVGGQRAEGGEKESEQESESGKDAGAKGVSEWYEAVDKESGEVYYYTADGRTVWEKPDELKTSEELAKDWVEQQGKVEPSFLEKQIKSKAEEISRLEVERDAAMAASEMAKFKEINASIRSLRKELESLSAQANTSAVVHVEQERGAWEQFGDTLRDTPILKDLFGFGAKLGDTEAAKKARNVAEDAREAWETSQNPWVYSAYSAWESVFAETEMGETIRELRKLDPTFTFENLLVELEEDIVPEVLTAYLRGDVPTLDKWCSEAAGAAVKASINQRNSAGRKMDDNILSIDHMQIAAAKVVDKMGPLVVVQFMVQQIDCLYDLKGKVVEGKDDKVAAVFYAFALGRDYNEEQAELEWKIREFAIIGTQPWT